MAHDELVPGGAQTISKFPTQFPGAYPRSIVRGDGAYVWDDRGTRYVDWICGLGAVGLGYRHAAVDAAVVGQVMRGPIFPLPNVELEARVARKLVDIVPCAESVRFVKTGSEATEAAVRVARAYTGRDVVLTCGYHGWHSWCAATRDEHPGVPAALTYLARPFAYNDLPSLDAAIAWAERPCPSGPFRSGVAAIILEPTLIEPPYRRACECGQAECGPVSFLEDVRLRAREHGAVLIFDEMVTGFRWRRGGYQAAQSVVPDLATFGKALGNGYPIAALVGRADIMQHARLVSGTFNGDCIGLAAADAVLDTYAQRDVCAHMRRLGRALIDGYNTIAAQTGAPTRMVGQPPHPKIEWDEEGVGSERGVPGAYEPARAYANRHRASLFYQEVVRRGHLLHPNGMNVMLAHGERDVVDFLAACGDAMLTVLSAVRNNRVRESIEGDPISPESPWRTTA